ncbi:MAG: hypothetical protein FJ088_01270, partial [Deltaproteobacteria bacterium]|nr:hypothetical protein [Deltaproteobacteria bacterium]
IATPAVDYHGSYDYSELAENSDGLMIMAYGYHWKSSDPGPISPLTSGEIWGKYNVTWTVNDYLEWGGVENRHKFLLGVPFYGYDYPSSDDKIPGKATGSATTVRYRKAEIDGALFGWKWDDDSQTSYYLYNKTQWHQVFCDDAESLGLKFSLIVEKDLGGIGIWALGYEGESMEIWNELADKFGTILHHTGSDETEGKDGVLKEIKIKPAIYPGPDYPQNFKSHYNLSNGGNGGGCSFSQKYFNDHEGFIVIIVLFLSVILPLNGRIKKP